MTLKRLKQPVIGGAVLAALALGGSTLAGGATAARGSSSTASGDIPSANASAAPAPLTYAGGGSLRPMNDLGDSPAYDVYLTDHERYLRHHRRLTLEA